MSSNTRSCRTRLTPPCCAAGASASIATSHGARRSVSPTRSKPRRRSSPIIITEAGLAEPAARYWLKAAELALSRSAPIEASRYVDAGLALIPHLTDGPDRQSLELALQIARANALFALKGYTAPETVAALTAAKRLLDSGVGRDLQRFSVLFGLCVSRLHGCARMEPALALARQIVEFADRQDDPTYRLVGYGCSAMTQIAMGQHREALGKSASEPSNTAIRAAEVLSYRFAFDPGLAALCYKMWALSIPRSPESGGASNRERCGPELPESRACPHCRNVQYLRRGVPELCLAILKRSSATAPNSSRTASKEKWSNSACSAPSSMLARARYAIRPEEYIAAFRAAIDANHRSGRVFNSIVHP